MGIAFPRSPFVGRNGAEGTHQCPLDAALCFVSVSVSVSVSLSLPLSLSFLTRAPSYDVIALEGHTPPTCRLGKKCSSRMLLSGTRTTAPR